MDQVDIGQKAEAVPFLPDPASAAPADYSLLTTSLDDWQKFWVRSTEDALRTQDALLNMNMADVNEAFKRKFQHFLKTKFGRHMADRLMKEMDQGALVVPVYLTEEFVIYRLKKIIRRKFARWAMFFGFRATISSIVLNGIKTLAKRVTRRNRVLHGLTCFVTDVMFPTQFFGPVLGLIVGVNQLTTGKSSHSVSSQFSLQLDNYTNKRASSSAST